MNFVIKLRLYGSRYLTYIFIFVLNLDNSAYLTFPFSVAPWSTESVFSSMLNGAHGKSLVWSQTFLIKVFFYFLLNKRLVLISIKIQVKHFECTQQLITRKLYSCVNNRQSYNCKRYILNFRVVKIVTNVFCVFSKIYFKMLDIIWQNIELVRQYVTFVVVHAR